MQNVPQPVTKITIQPQFIIQPQPMAPITLIHPNLTKVIMRDVQYPMMIQMEIVSPEVLAWIIQSIIEYLLLDFHAGIIQRQDIMRI